MKVVTVSQEEEIKCGEWSVGGPQDHNLSLSNLVEGLPELRKTVRLTVIVYYSEKIQIEIRKGKET